MTISPQEELVGWVCVVCRLGAMIRSFHEKLTELVGFDYTEEEDPKLQEQLRMLSLDILETYPLSEQEKILRFLETGTALYGAVGTVGQVVSDLMETHNLTEKDFAQARETHKLQHALQHYANLPPDS